MAETKGPVTACGSVKMAEKKGSVTAGSDLEEASRPNTAKALWFLAKAVSFCVLSVSSLSLAPAWLIPLCWLSVTGGFILLFEIGFDCSSGNFFASKATNWLVGSVALLPWLQPSDLWADASPPSSSSSYFGHILNYWRQRVRPLHANCVLLFVFAAWFFPWLAASTGGMWGIVNFYVIPFTLATLWISFFFNSVRKEDGNDNYKGVDVFGLASTLRFRACVPLYSLPAAVSSLLNRKPHQQKEEEDGEKDEIDFHAGFASSSFRRGLAKLRVVETLVSTLMLLFSCVWAVLWWTSHGSVDSVRTLVHEHTVALVVVAVLGVLFALRSYYAPRTVYVSDFVTYRPDPETRDRLRVTHERFNELQSQVSNFTEESRAFMSRLLARTGLGEDTIFPPSTFELRNDIKAAREEAELVMFGVCDELFARNDIDPREIDVLVVNCSLFCPTPSLASMIVKKYRMREDIKSFNLGGMGCSAGVIAVDLARDLLQIQRGRALVVSWESITQNWYHGNEKGMLISNTLFRMGGAAVLLSSRPLDRFSSRYQLLHTVRTHRGGSDSDAYDAVYQDTDADKLVGVRLSKQITKVAGRALKSNMTSLGPLILPLKEQVKYLWSLVMKRKPYVPRFKAAVQHICVHAGGRAVIEAIEQNLDLASEDVQDSKDCLRENGNTSSSSIWYELALMEQRRKIRRGDRIWQIAFGSGFKCNSAVLEAL